MSVKRMDWGWDKTLLSKTLAESFASFKTRGETGRRLRVPWECHQGSGWLDEVRGIIRVLCWLFWSDRSSSTFRLLCHIYTLVYSSCSSRQHTKFVHTSPPTLEAFGVSWHLKPDFGFAWMYGLIKLYHGYLRDYRPRSGVSVVLILTS
jgi:hypothetical protein